jgi:hypothetical protein
MEPAPVAALDPILVSDDEEDPEEVNPEEGEPVDQQNHEEQAPGKDLEDYHGPKVEEEEQEQDEAAEEVIWDVYHYRVDGVGIPIDHLGNLPGRSCALNLIPSLFFYKKAPTPIDPPHFKLLPSSLDLDLAIWFLLLIQ